MYFYVFMQKKFLIEMNIDIVLLGAPILKIFFSIFFSFFFSLMNYSSKTDIAK